MTLNASYAGRSSDGTRVAFSTLESLAATDTDTAADVYVRQSGGALVHVTDGPGPDGNLNAGTFAVSADATAVVFATSEALAPTDTDTTLDGYLRLPSGALVHVTDDLTGADDALDAVVLDASPDLARVVIATKERLARTDTDTAYDIYERVPDGTLVHLSDDPTGPDANVDAEFERLSTDVRRVYFSDRREPVAGGHRRGRGRLRRRAGAGPSGDAATAARRPTPRRRRSRGCGRCRGGRGCGFRLSEAATVRIVVRRRGGAPGPSRSRGGQARTRRACGSTPVAATA